MPETSRHHIYPRSQGGSDDPRNIKKMDHNLHQRHHMRFGTMPPHEQLMDILNLSYQVLQTRFYEELVEMLKDPDWIYEKGIYIKKKTRSDLITNLSQNEHK